MSVWKRGGRKNRNGGCYISLSDKTGSQPVRRTFRALTSDVGVAREVERKVKNLLASRLARRLPDEDVVQWLDTMPVALRRQLAKAGILDEAGSAEGSPIAFPLIGYYHAQKARGNDPRHVRPTIRQIGKMVRAKGIRYLSDITAGAVTEFLDSLRLGSKTVSPRTRNAYLTAVKGFCTWAVRVGRLASSPVSRIEPVRAPDEETRGAFTVEEMLRLLEAAAKAPVRFGMRGTERALLYRVAVETGYRAGELRSLTKESFDLDTDRPTVRLRAASSKGRRRSVLPLRPDTASLLRAHLASKLPTAPAFHNMPDFRRTAKMIRADMTDADVPRKDGQGRERSFHSLRHTCGTWLASRGVHAKEIQTIMRHSTIRMTMDRYVHTDRQQTAGALARLPDLSGPSGQVSAATGTDDSPPKRDRNHPSAAQSAARAAQNAARNRHRSAPGDAPIGAKEKDGAAVSPVRKAPNGASRRQGALMGAGGFEPPKAEPSDLQSDPFDHSGTLPTVDAEV